MFILPRNIWTTEHVCYAIMDFDQYTEKLNGQDPLFQDTKSIIFKEEILQRRFAALSVLKEVFIEFLRSRIKW